MKKLDNWGQSILVPTKEEWSKILTAGELNGFPLSSTTIEFATRDLEEFECSPDVVLGLVDQPGRNLYLRMLEIDDVLHRVHFEDVICEHCNKRSGVSAMPDRVMYAGASRAKEAEEAAWNLQVKKCKHCDADLKHRHTIWFKQH